jgi:hypothetical protein
MIYSGSNLAQNLTKSLNNVGTKLAKSLHKAKAQSWQKIDTKLKAKMMYSTSTGNVQGWAKLV